MRSEQPSTNFYIKILGENRQAAGIPSKALDPQSPEAEHKLVVVDMRQQRWWMNRGT